MLASILIERENIEWLRCANKYAENTRKTDCGFYKEYDYVVQMLRNLTKNKKMVDGSHCWDCQT